MFLRAKHADNQDHDNDLYGFKKILEIIKGGGLTMGHAFGGAMQYKEVIN